MRRRSILSFAAGALATPAVRARAQDASSYPDRPVRFIVPFPAGGATDAWARIAAEGMQPELGQTIIIDNRGGAGGKIGAEAVARAQPDGYTLLAGSVSTHSFAPVVTARLNYDPIKDFEPISQLVTAQYVLIVHPSVPARSVAELVRLAKAKPRSLNYSSGGTGSPLHLAGELFKSRAGIDLVHIPYKGGGPAATAVMTGEAQLIFGSIASSAAHVRAGRLRALAVTGPKRSALEPQLPTMHESGYPGFNVTAWHSYVAPAGTPREIVNRIHAAALEVLRTPEVVKAVGSAGYEVTGTTPEQLGQIIRSESEMWAKVIKTAGIKGE